MLYRTLLAIIAIGFAVAFGVIVAPPLAQSWDIAGAVRDGFVNPYAAGFSLDAILTWCVLAIWIVHEARSEGIRWGWIAILLGVVPGVATGLAAYLLIRETQRRAHA